MKLHFWALYFRNRLETKSKWSLCGKLVDADSELMLFETYQEALQAKKDREIKDYNWVREYKVIKFTGEI